MKTVLLYTERDLLDENDISQIQKALPGREVLVTKDHDIILKNKDSVEIAAFWIPRRLLSEFPNLKWYHSWSAGVEKAFAHVSPGVLISNSRGVHPIPMTEHIFGLLLALGRNLDLSVRNQQNKIWTNQFERPFFEISGKIMLIAGLGTVGRQVALTAKGFGMKVIGIQRNPDQPVAGVDALYKKSDLDSVLPQADFIVNILPLTRNTENFFGADQFELMKKEAVFANMGRGRTVDTEALIKALEQKQIMGACLDTVEPEPLPEDSPLWDMPNVILSGHSAGMNQRYDERAFSIFLDHILCYAKGEVLPNLVDRTAGY